MKKVLFFILCVASNAMAIEPICPGGASPRGDITWCSDFDTLANCSTGYEPACYGDSGVTGWGGASAGFPEGFKILPCPGGAAVGTGCVYGSGVKGGTGPGFMSRTPFTGTATAGMRFMVKFMNGYLQSVLATGNHGPGLKYSDGASCSGYITFDWFTVNPSISGIPISHFALQNEMTGTTCGGNAPTSNLQAFPTTDATWRPRNGVWYTVEMKVTMNTTASSSSGTSGNGTYTVLIDGVTYLSQTNLNIRGNSATAVFNDAYLARSYYGAGVPAWQPNIAYDNFVFSNNATTIGVPSPANSFGTADATSPYHNYTAYQSFEQSKLGGDCSTPGSYTTYPQTGMDNIWGSGVAYVASPAKNAYANACTANRNSMRAQLSVANSQAGVTGDDGLKGSPGRYVIHTQIYFPSSNSYASDTPVMGFTAPGVTTGFNIDKGILLGRNNAGNWMLYQKNDPAVTKTDLGVAATTDVWHEVELHAATGDKYSVYVDGVWIRDEATAPVAFDSWLGSPPGSGQRKWLLGIFEQSPASTFSVYYDDADIGTASFISSKGWGTSSPFSSGGLAGAFSLLRVGK